MTTEDKDRLDPVKAMADAQRARIDTHAAYRASEPFKAALGRVDRLIGDYGVAVNAIDLMATRWPPSSSG